MHLDHDNKYNIGDTVYAKVDPEVKLIVRKYYARIYYCKFADLPMKKELALFDREIISNN